MSRRSRLWAALPWLILVGDVGVCGIAMLSGGDAFAKKLLIALWRFVEFGVVPEGAIISQRLRLA